MLVISLCLIFHFSYKTHKIVFLQKPLPVAGLPLLKTQENHLGWESVHLDPNEPGAMGYLGTLEHFALEHVATVNISFDEDYYPNFDYLRREYQTHVDSGEIAISASKHFPADFRARYGKRYVLKVFKISVRYVLRTFFYSGSQSSLC